MKCRFTLQYQYFWAIPNWNYTDPGLTRMFRKLWFTKRKDIWSLLKHPLQLKKKIRLLRKTDPFTQNRSLSQPWLKWKNCLPWIWKVSIHAVPNGGSSQGNQAESHILIYIWNNMFILRILIKLTFIYVDDAYVDKC